MDLAKIAGKALYGPGAKGLYGRAEKLGIDLFQLQELGAEKLQELDPGDAAKGEGYLVTVARNAMQDATRVLRRADKGKPSDDAAALDERLRRSGEVELVGFEEAELDVGEPKDADDTEYARRRKRRKQLDERHTAGGDQVDYQIRRSSPTWRAVVTPKTGRRPSHIDREAFSEQALKDLVDLLNTTERTVVDLSLLGHTQENIAETLDKSQGYISKVYRTAIEKLDASEYSELRALGWEVRYAGREARHHMPGEYPHPSRVVKPGASVHKGGTRRPGAARKRRITQAVEAARRTD